MSGNAPAPARVELIEVGPSPGKSVAEVLSNNRQRHYFGGLARYYSGLMLETESDLRQRLEAGGTVLYLIDADVVRNLVEETYQDTKLRREATKLFANPNFEYALPLGAFQELLHWLRSFSQYAIPWGAADPVGSMSADLTVREIAQMCNVPYDRGDSREDVVKRVLTSLSANRGVFDRLLNFLTSPGFKGVIADYDLSDVAALHRVIGQAPRDNRSNNTRLALDYHDAINLAIVFKNSRSRKDTDTAPTGLLLITQTRALLHLPAFVSDLDSEYAHAISTLLSFEGPVIDSVYPVLSPKRAFVVEEMRRAFGSLDDDSVFERIRAERNLYDDLAAVLGRSARRHSIATSLSTDPELLRCFEHLRTVYYGEESVFRELEADRATESSVSYFEAKHETAFRPPEERKVPEGLLSEVNAYFRVLRNVHISVNTLAPTTYSLQLTNDDTGLFDCIALHSFRPDELLMEGELYYRAPGEDDGRRSVRAYSLTWRTSCTERQFFAALAAIIRVPRSARRRPPLRLRRPDRWGPEWNQGMIVFTNSGVFSAELEDASVRWALRSLTIGEILRTIARFYGAGEERPERPGVTISAVRFNTLFGDFQMDVIPEDGLDRQIMVVSHYNISEQIAHLCEETSLFGVLPFRLNEELRVVCGQFPVFEGGSRS